MQIMSDEDNSKLKGEVPHEDNSNLKGEVPHEDIDLLSVKEESNEEPQLLFAKEESDEDTDFLRLPIWHAGVNFTNILRAAFPYESVLSSFSVLSA